MVLVVCDTFEGLGTLLVRHQHPCLFLPTPHTCRSGVFTVVRVLTNMSAHICTAAIKYHIIQEYIDRRGVGGRAGGRYRSALITQGSVEK